jgi:serine/threonine protein kinase
MKINLGNGGFGAVYKAILWNTVVAVKKVIVTKDCTLEDIKKELIITNAISHPNLIKLINWAIDKEGVNIVMEHIDGDSLEKVLRKNSISNNQKKYVLERVASSLLYLHSFNPPILHYDVKSSNVMLTKNNEVFLIDFGLSKQLTTIYMNKTSSTEGSIYWMDPAIFDNIKYTTKSDVYSFGILIYEILTNQLPYSYDIQMLKAHLFKDLVKDGLRPDLQFIPNDVPKLLVELMERCWNIELNKRPEFEEICEILNKIQW